MSKHDKLQPDDDASSPDDPCSQPMTVNQLRAGRAIARLGVRELAKAAGLSVTAISRLESGHTRNPHKATLAVLRAALAARGVDFAPGGWTRHISDACATQRPPSDCIRSPQASHEDDDRPEE